METSHFLTDRFITKFLDFALITKRNLRKKIPLRFCCVISVLFDKFINLRERELLIFS